MKHLKNKLILIMCFFIFAGSGLSASNFSSEKKCEEVSVTYVGNAGFLIKIGDKKILIDALFKGFEGDYILPEQIQEKLTLAKAPFDDVDIVFVTHAHGDHISADMVQQHMRNNPKAIFVSTKQTVDALNARDTVDNFQERRIGFNPSKEKSDKKNVKGISVEALYLPHGPDARIINNGFLVSVNGVTFFHTGDVDFDQFTFEEFRSLQLPEKNIDLSFIQHFYLTSDSTSSQFVNKGIGSKFILPIHYHFTTPSFDAAIVKENYPKTIIFEKELDSWQMPDKETIFTNLKGDYLGQTPPGDVPSIFAPGIISVNGRYEYGVSFTPDLKEIYFTGHKKGESSSVYFSKIIDKKWTNPKRANLTNGKKKAEMEAFVNLSGDKIYFTAYDSKDVKIWCATRSGDWWSDAIKLDSPINDDIVFYSNEAKNGDLFYKNVSKGKMYYAPNKNGKFPEIFEAGIEYGSHGFIAPSQDFILIDALKENDKTKDKDIHVCFKEEDGTWTKPINLGSEVNSNFNETCPSITPDGKYLFFSRYDEEGGLPNIYWVSAGVIGKLKEKAFKEIKLTEELFKAVDADDLDKVKLLIKSNPNLLEIKDKAGSTPLIRACLNFRTFGRQVEVAKFLIDAGANVNVVNNYQATALLRASVGRGPDYELIKLLVSKGADVNMQGYNGITALHWAVMYNKPEIVKFLLESGANVNINNDYNGPIRTSTISGTVLQVAINYSKNNEMVKLIIENGAKLNIKDSQGNTELHLVALKGNTEQAKILIENGIDLNAENNFNRTALYYAAKHGYRGVAELLIASGADKNTIAETNYGKAKQLSESLEEGEAYIWDLNFSYAVKTKNNLLVFTLGGGIGESSESGLANGFLNADELNDQKITVFLRHRGNWPMDGKRFTELAKLTSNVKMVSSIKPDFSNMDEVEIPAYHLALPNESFSLDGIKVHPIPALASGMGYLVEVDGLKIFHAGLHISDDKAEHIKKYRKEIDFLKPFGPVDIVMLPTHSHSNDVETGYEQYLYLLDELAPKAIYLWGANVPEQYIQCAEFLKVRNIPIVYPEIRGAAGARFHYLRDKAE